MDYINKKYLGFQRVQTLWGEFESAALKSRSFAVLREALRVGESVLFESLWDVPKALVAAYALMQTGRSVILVTGGADRILDNLQTMVGGRAVELPSWQALLGEKACADLIGKRFEVLNGLEEPMILVCGMEALLQKVVRKSELGCVVLGKGSKICEDVLKGLGYVKRPVVSDKGEYAVRGGIIDIFPVSATDPFRVELWGEEIEELRTFDLVSQKSVGKAKEIFLSPADEMALLRRAERFCSVVDYLKEPLIFWDDFVALEDQYVALGKMNNPFLYSLKEVVKGQQMVFGAPKPVEALSSVKKRGERIAFETCGHSFEAHRWGHAFQQPIDFFAPEPSDFEFLELLPKELKDVVFLSSTETEEGEVKKRLEEKGVGGARFERGYLTSGFALCDAPLVVIPNGEVTGHKRIRRQKWRGTSHTPVAAEFSQLEKGELVVHYHSGIGRYLGVEKHRDHKGAENEFLVIQYAQESKLFVPMSQAYLISRYIGSSEEIPNLSQLGSKRWQNTRVQAQQQILGYAKELLELYARRSVEGGIRFPPDSDLMKRFEKDFPYTETGDQLISVAAVKEDMMSEKPMDRLISGDVGYGKTEVAMRAAFKAVADGGKQVAVLVPTTVLAMQHYETFCQRMSGFPVRIEVLSRFRTAKQNREALRRCEAGEIDILIGTHRLLSKDVRFHDLGLLIIDEEQRFGVRAKEHLKHAKAGVDCLALSATPIPRSLYLSLVHARDMSVIGTPPQDRLPVKTVIAEPETELIRGALLREFMRGGQAFFIHNRVETIAGRATEIQKLVPDARIGIVHGQMDPDAIDPVFHRFKEGAIDLLFATTIVESGVDIPNANTILIDRADTYGLSDLYQLRGRVGRWNRAAYAYFFVPKHARLSDIARKRLNAIAEAGSYGGGMKIAMRDLEIRGAGDILGLQQSGQISSVGFHLYCKMLKRAIDALKSKRAISFNETKMEFSYDARIPDSFLEEPSLRMEFYYRFGEASQLPEVEELLKELQDRFGEPPEPVLWLYHLSRIRIFAAANHFTLLKFQNFSLVAERQMGNKVEQKTFLLGKAKSPEDLERLVVDKLRGFAP